jgi:hypothetical protein
MSDVGKQEPISFRVPCVPVAQPRARATTINGAARMAYFSEVNGSKITGRGNANSRIPKHEQPVKEAAMSEGNRNCALPVLPVDDPSRRFEYLLTYFGYAACSDGTIWSCLKLCGKKRLR